jgi:hypothetical protein
MMSFPSKATAGILTILLAIAEAQQCSSPDTLTCMPVADASITLNANLDEWADVAGIKTALFQSGGDVKYTPGEATYKCLHSDTHLYLSLEVPGDYRFNATDNAKCAAIATMMKIGAEATYDNMGGCPEVLADPSLCDNGAPASCDSYLVDIGAHWELATTKQGMEYGINITGGTGDDPIANKDDEYAVSPECRWDDNDAPSAGNEWAGAWRHTNPTDGETGTYIFELSRLLSTKSSKTDSQMVVGGTYSFGIAYWDPFETDAGWVKDNHFLTGCGTQFTDLVLATSSPVSPNSGGMGMSSSKVLLLLVGAVVFLTGNT